MSRWENMTETIRRMWNDPWAPRVRHSVAALFGVGALAFAAMATAHALNGEWLGVVGRLVTVAMCLQFVRMELTT
jgi:hypothetical protein